MNRIRLTGAAAIVFAAVLVAVTPAAAGCGDTWTVSEQATVPAWWEDVSIADSTHAWAVGDDVRSAFDRMTIARWDGSTWADDTPTLFAKSIGSGLNSVWAGGPDDVWAVGWVEDSTYSIAVVILHRTAAGWSVDARFAPGDEDPSLESVWEDGSGGVWTVGSTIAGGRPVGITYHRTGPDWVQVPFPRDGVGTRRELNGVGGSGPGDVWVVGSEVLGLHGFSQSIAYHWTGTTWEPTAVPIPRTDLDSDLLDVVAPDASHAWAVGYFAGVRRMLLERWDGTSWERVYIPNRPGVEILTGVAATSATNAVAVGSIGQDIPLIRTWNGHRWSDAVVPSVATELADVSLRSGVGGFAAGKHGDGTILATCG